MKIKLAILDTDQMYLNRIVSAFEKQYSSKLEIYCFTDQEKALAILADTGIHVLLAANSFVVEASRLPTGCGFAYLVESPEIERFREQMAICKYQKMDLLYKSIIGVFSERNSGEFELRVSGNDPRMPLYVFTSAGGGTGASSVAAACAKSFTRTGRRVLYLNLEAFGIADHYFTGAGQYDLRDVLVALKMRKTNAMLKLESSVKKDPSGVFYLSSPRNARDVCDLAASDLDQLLSLCRRSDNFDCLIVDINFTAGERELVMFRQAAAIVFVIDGTEQANQKLVRAYETLTVSAPTGGDLFLKRIALYYNKFSNKTGKHVELANVSVLGGAPKYENLSNEQIVEKLSQAGDFNKLDTVEVAL